MIHYDGSVRNAIGEIVELTYGGDGLDPVFMEVKNKPVDLNRQLNHIRAMYPFRYETPLQAGQITTAVERILQEDEFENYRADFRKECL